MLTTSLAAGVGKQCFIRDLPWAAIEVVNNGLQLTFERSIVTLGTKFRNM